MTVLPAAAAIGVLCLPAGRVGWMRALTVAALAASTGLALAMLGSFQPGGGFQFVERLPWIAPIGAEYHVGVDGISLPMVALTGPVCLLALCLQRIAGRETRAWFSLLLIEATALWGAFTALNFFHWFLFWELCLVPAFLLIKLYGGGRRDVAALGFFLFTVLGSAPMLVGFLALYAKSGTFGFPELARMAAEGGLAPRLGGAWPWAGAAILLAFWAKAPLAPLHAWQPAAYAEAPAPVAILLAALLSKLGIYGLFRVAAPMLPDLLARWAPGLAGLALLTVLLGAFAALRQTDMKRLLAYVSLSHVALCALAVCVAASGGPERALRSTLEGAALQMLTHGMVVAGLFFMAGCYEARFGGKPIGSVGGLGGPMPRFAGFLGFFCMAALGLPFLAVFPGEFMIFSGLFGLRAAWAAAAAPALLAITAVFLTLIQRVLCGPFRASEGGGGVISEVRDLRAGEWLPAGAAALAVVGVGVFPGYCVGLLAGPVRAVVLVFGGG